MQAWTILLSRLFVTLLSLMMMNPEGAEAGQKARKMAVSQKNSPIVGELDDDTIPSDESNDEAAADEGEAAAPKAKERVKGGDKKGKQKEKSAKEKAKEKQAAQRRKKLMEGFSKAEEFHKTWYHLPPSKIKVSHENLIKFCKVACTKNSCMDEEVANHCHLMCPAPTTRQCPDPLKKASDESLNAEEVLQGDDDIFPDALPFAGGPGAQVPSPSVSSSLEQADAALKDGDGEGG